MMFILLVWRSSRGRTEQLLVRWAYPQLHDIDALDRMVDPALKGLYPAKSLSRFADVIALCVQVTLCLPPPSLFIYLYLAIHPCFASFLIHFEGAG